MDNFAQRLRIRRSRCARPRKPAARPRDAPNYPKRLRSRTVNRRRAQLLDSLRTSDAARGTHRPNICVTWTLGGGRFWPPSSASVSPAVRKIRSGRAIVSVRDEKGSSTRSQARSRSWILNGGLNNLSICRKVKNSYGETNEKPDFIIAMAAPAVPYRLFSEAALVTRERSLRRNCSSKPT